MPEKEWFGGALLTAILCLSGVGDCGEVGDMYDICNTLDMLVGYANILIISEYYSDLA